MKTNPGYHFICVLNSIFYLTVVQSHKHFSLTEVKNPHEYQWRLLGSSEVWGPQLCSAYCANNINCDAYSIAETENSQKSANNHWGNNKYTCQLRQISREVDSSNEEAIGTTFQVNRDSNKLIPKIQATISAPNKDIVTTNNINTATTDTTTNIETPDTTTVTEAIDTTTITETIDTTTITEAIDTTTITETTDKTNITETTDKTTITETTDTTTITDTIDATTITETIDTTTITETTDTTTITETIDITTVTSTPSTSTTTVSAGCLPCNVSSAFYDNSNKRPVVICDSNDIYTLDVKDLCYISPEKSTIKSKLTNYNGKTVTAAFNLKSNVVAFQDEGGDWYFYTYTPNDHNSIAKDVIVPDHIKNNKYHFATNINNERILLVGENNNYDCVSIHEFDKVPKKGSQENKSQEEKTKKDKKKSNNGNGKGATKKKCKKNDCEENDVAENQKNNSDENETKECDEAMKKIAGISAGERIGNLYYLFHENNATTISV